MPTEVWEEKGSPGLTVRRLRSKLNLGKHVSAFLRPMRML